MTKSDPITAVFWNWTPILSNRQTQPENRGMDRVDVWEKNWIESARGGDKEAFGRLVRQHEAGLIAYLSRWVNDRQTARDLAQTTFLAAWRKLDAFRGESQFKTWLYSIATRKAQDHLRRKPPDRPNTFQPPDEERIVDTRTLDPLASLLADESARRLAAAIRDLPPLMRAVAALRLYEGDDYRTIAQSTGSKIGRASCRERV